MTTTRTIARNTGVAALAVATGKNIRFTYTDEAGVTTRRTVKPLEIKPTRKTDRGVLVVSEEGLSVRTFRSDRCLRVRIV